MVTELTLLKLFLSDRDFYQKYKPYIRLGALSQEAGLILTDLGFYFKDVEKLVLEQFITWFFQVQHPEFNDAKAELFRGLFTQIESTNIEAGDGYAETILKHFKARDYKDRIEVLLQSNHWSPDAVQSLVAQYEKEVSTEKDDDFADPSPDKIVSETTKTGGVPWPLKCIQNTLGNLVKGEFGVIAAPVGTGKTAFLVNVLAGMLPYITKGDVLWFTTEQTPSKILRRLYCRICDVTDDEFERDPSSFKKQYKDFMHGDMKRVKVFDGNGLFVTTLSRRIKKYHPQLVIIDMLDHILLKGNKDVSDWRGMQRLYHATRMLARDCPIIASSQTSADTKWQSDGETHYKHYLDMNQMTATKVEKQGAADFIMMLGHDPKWPKTRFLNICKTKTGKEMKTEIAADIDKAFFTDCTVGGNNVN